MLFMMRKGIYMACKECRYDFGHHPRCPEADDLVVVHKCMECRNEIYEGDTYYHIGELICCEDCGFGFREVAEERED